MAPTKYYLRRGPAHPNRVQLFPWQGLPLEIKFLVFENLVPSRDKAGFFPTRGSHLAAYSVVCREFQAFFEKIIYDRLVVNQNDIPRYAKLTAHHASLVRHLWLRTETPRYDCSECRSRCGPKILIENGGVLGRALVALFEALRRFEEVEAGQASGANGRNLTLEISSHSPSDSEHQFKDISFDGIDVAGEEGLNGRRTSPATLTTLRRLFGGYLGILSPLPHVYSVKHLLLRRQTRYGLNGSTMQCMFEALPSLQTVRHEPWRARTRRLQDEQDECMFWPIWLLLPFRPSR